MIRICAIKDEKANVYSNNIIPVNTVVEALRGWTTVVNSPDSIYSKFPEDFSFVEIGTFDPKTGNIVPGIQKLAGAADVKN